MKDNRNAEPDEDAGALCTMTPRRRLLNTLRGEPTDRVPIFTHVPFGVTAEGLAPAPFHGSKDPDDWRRRDPAYCRIVQRMQDECDNIFVWSSPAMRGERFLVPPSMTRTAAPETRGDRIVTTRVIESGGKQLRTVSSTQRGSGTQWVHEHFCKEPVDAEWLLELPWERQQPSLDDLPQLTDWLGDLGVVWVSMHTPLTPVCRLFDPTDFLLIARDEPKLIHRLMQTVAQRMEANLRVLLDAGAGPIIRFGGAEHATPPLMSPADFDELVVRYDTPLMRLVKDRGHMVAVHCHGNIRHALGRFVEMGVDQTDPVETIPDGDLTLGEARRIAAGRITLTGNTQMRELYSETPSYIRQRVRQAIEDAGPDHLIVSTTGTPLENIGPALEANYNAMIDAALDYGRR